MGQINVSKQATHKVPAEGSRAYTFNALGVPGYINEAGTFIALSQEGISENTIVANLGVGLSADLPETAEVGDIYVTTDTLQIYTREDSISWRTEELLEKSIVTDTSSERAFMYQRVGDTLIVIASNEYSEITIGNVIIRYNSDLDVIEFEYENGSIYQASREDTDLTFIPSTSAPIPNGTPTIFDGVGGKTGEPNAPIIVPADASSIATAMAKGHTTIPGIPGEYCITTCRGNLTKVGHGLAVGARLWLANGGGYTTTPPSAPNLSVEVGIVIDEDTIRVCPPIFPPITNTTTSTSSNLFMTNTDSSISGYKAMGDLEVAETMKTITGRSSTSPVAGDKYLSEPLGVTSLPNGAVEMTGVVKIDNKQGETRLEVVVSLYHEDGSTTLLAYNISPDINNETDETIGFSAPYTAVASMEVTDRLLAETYLITSANQNKTLTYYTGEGKGAYLSIPLPLSHTDLVKLNEDPDFQHLTTSQVSKVDNSVQKVTSTDNAVVRFNGTTGQVQDSIWLINEQGNQSVEKTVFPTPNDPSILIDILQTKSSGTGNIKGLRIESISASDSDSGVNYPIEVYALHQGTGKVDWLYSISGYARNESTGYAENIAGVYGQGRNQGEGRVNKLLGGDFLARNNSSSILNNDMYGLTGKSENTGMADQAYGGFLWVENTGTLRELNVIVCDVQGTGTVTEQIIGIDMGREHPWEAQVCPNVYGMYIGETVATQGSETNYAIFSKSPADSHLTGNLGIGTDNPTSKLHVIGDITVSGTTKVYSDIHLLKSSTNCIKTNTEDGSDFSAIALQSFGGLFSMNNSRGASILVTGNEYATLPGSVRNYASTGKHYFFVEGTEKAHVDSEGLHVDDDITVSGTVDGRDVAVDGEVLDDLEYNKTNYRYTFDLCESAINQVVIPQDSFPRFRKIKNIMSAITDYDNVGIPNSIYIKYYDKDGVQQIESFAIATSIIGIVGQSVRDLECDLSHGDITIEASQETGTTHVYELYLQIL
jgi:hypothetical protein